MLVLLAALAARATTCQAYGELELVLEATEVPVAESSGLAAARSRPGTWFTHNDSGDTARVYAFTLDGTYQGSHDVEGVVSVDWEDLAAGPCPDHLQARSADCLYIADVGDNLTIRTWVSVYVVTEPAAGEAATVLERWDGSWPDGSADCETLLVHPRTGRVYLVSKDAEGPSKVVRFSAHPEPETPEVLEAVATLDLAAWGVGDRATTGGDWDPDGERVVIRTYNHALIWATDPCAPDEHWTRAPDELVALPEAGGEAIAFDPAGDVYTTTEGSPMRVSRLACQQAGGGEAWDCPEPDTGADLDSADTGQGAAREEGGCGCSGGKGAALPLLLTGGLAGKRRRRARVSTSTR